MTHKKKIIWEYAKAIITALMLALLIRAFIIQAFKIPSGSMIPTLLVGDHILVNKFLYGTKIPFKDKRAFMFKKPERGDIIVFKYPENPEYCKGLSSTVMKRIKNAVERREVWQLLTDDCKDFIKKGGSDRRRCNRIKNKMIHVNGNKVNEPYAQHTDSSMRPMGIEPRDNFGLL